MSCLSSQLGPEDYRDLAYARAAEEVDIDVSAVATLRSATSCWPPHESLLLSPQTKLSRLCEQDKVVRTQEDKLKQLYREKVTTRCTSVTLHSLCDTHKRLHTPDSV